MAILPGRRLGPYQILSAIGAGGTGEVYEAEDLKLHCHVALKFLLQTILLCSLQYVRGPNERCNQGKERRIR